MELLVKWQGIFVYEIFDLFPNILLALTPFYSYMRLSRVQTSLFALLLYILLSISRFFALYSTFLAASLTFMWILFYLAFYILCVRTDFRKLLFVLLIILNYGNFVIIIYSFILSSYIPHFADRPYDLPHSITLCIIHLIGFPFMYRLMNGKIKLLIESNDNNRYWNFLWLVPATFYLSYFYNLYSHGGIVPFCENPKNVLFACFFNLGAIFVTYLATLLIEISNINLQLESELYALNMQSVQYDTLKTRMENASRAVHDLRQVLTVIHTYIKDDNTEGLLTYINQYTQSLPSTSPITYCENYTVNALLVYYEAVAAKNSIRFSVHITVPSLEGMTDTDAVVLLGNLLENAIEACARAKAPNAFVSLCIKKMQDMFIILVDNSCHHHIHLMGDTLLSSKTSRHGIGTASIRWIAQKYRGQVDFSCENNIFHASVALHLGASK